MSNKTSPKRAVQLFHKLVIVCDVLVDTLDELEQVSEFSQQFKGSLQDVKRKAEEIVEDAFEVEGVRNTTYIQEVSQKIDTVIRKNLRKF